MLLRRPSFLIFFAFIVVLDPGEVSISSLLEDCFRLQLVQGFDTCQQQQAIVLQVEAFEQLQQHSTSMMFARFFSVRFLDSPADWVAVWRIALFGRVATIIPSLSTCLLDGVEGGGGVKQPDASQPLSLVYFLQAQRVLQILPSPADPVDFSQFYSLFVPEGHTNRPEKHFSTIFAVIMIFFCMRFMILYTTYIIINYHFFTF